MKFYNKISASLLALTLVAGFTACSDEHAEYNPASQASGTQVFFPSTQTEVANFSVTDLDNSFEVVVSRAVKEGACNVKLEAAQSEANIFDIPAAVAFADGEAEAKLNITFDASKLVYDQPETITLTVDPDASTPYGVSSYSFTVTKPAPWTPWCKTKAQWTAAGLDAAAWPFGDCTGTCTYTYTQYYAGDDTGLPFQYRLNLNDPTIGEIRIDNWGGLGDPLYVGFNPETGDCTVAPQHAADHSSYGPVSISDIPNYSSSYSYSQFPCKYDAATGLFSLNVVWFVDAGMFGNGIETIHLDGFYVPDYSITLDYMGVLTNKEQNAFAQLMVNFGADTKSLKAFICEKSDDATAVADAIVAGEVEAVDLVKGINNIPLGDATGELKVVAVSFDETEVHNVEYVVFEYYGGGQASPWKSLGVGLFTDDIVITQYAYTDEAGNRVAYEPITYPVEIMENNDNPGLYRVMNAYSNSVYPYADGDCAEDGTFLEVNATDPEFVYILTQELGFDDWGGDGANAFVSEAGRYLEAGYDKATLLANNIFGGTLKAGNITFPVFTNKNGGHYQGILFCGDNGYYACPNGALSVVLPEAVPAAKMAKAKQNAKKAAALKLANRVAKKRVKAARLNVGKKMPRIGKPVAFK